MLIRPFINAFAVYNSYMIRPMSFKKPDSCNALFECGKKPWLFEDRNLCPDCSCVFSCRYMSGGRPEFVPVVIPEEKFPKNLVYQINGSAVQSIAYDDISFSSVYRR